MSWQQPAVASLGGRAALSWCVCALRCAQVTLRPGAYSIEETAYWSERVYRCVGGGWAAEAPRQVWVGRTSGTPQRGLGWPCPFAHPPTPAPCFRLSYVQPRDAAA